MFRPPPIGGLGGLRGLRTNVARERPPVGVLYVYRRERGSPWARTGYGFFGIFSRSVVAPCMGEGACCGGTSLHRISPSRPREYECNVRWAGVASGLGGWSAVEGGGAWGGRRWRGGLGNRRNSQEGEVEQPLLERRQA